LQIPDDTDPPFRIMLTPHSGILTPLKFGFVNDIWHATALCLAVIFIIPEC